MHMHTPRYCLFSPLPLFCPRRRLRALGSMKVLTPIPKSLIGQIWANRANHHHIVTSPYGYVGYWIIILG